MVIVSIVKKTVHDVHKSQKTDIKNNRISIRTLKNGLCVKIYEHIFDVV